MERVSSNKSENPSANIKKRGECMHSVLKISQEFYNLTFKKISMDRNIHLSQFRWIEIGMALQIIKCN